MADQVPARRACRRTGTNSASDPSGAATNPASNIAWSMSTLHGRALHAVPSAAPATHPEDPQSSREATRGGRGAGSSPGNLDVLALQMQLRDWRYVISRPSRPFQREMARITSHGSLPVSLVSLPQPGAG